MTVEQKFLILNPVHTDLADDFETYVRDVLGPAVEAQQPELRDKVRLWKASEPEPGSGAITIFAFVAEGVTSWDDLDLLPTFTAEYGEEEARRLLDNFGDFFADRETWVAAWTASLALESEEQDGQQDGQQYGWQMQQLQMYPSA